jgi:hypothetical protein
MNEIKKDVSERVLKIKSIIEENKDLWKLQEIQNFYNNILNNKDITDYEKEFLAEPCEKLISEKFPKKNPRRILNNKSLEAKELLEEVHNIVTKEFNWSKNSVKNGVKPSGHMIGGKIYVGWYMSYKNENKVNTGFGYIKEKEESDPYLKVDYRKVGQDFNEEKTFPIQLKDDALILFKNYLSKAINNKDYK